MSDIIESVKKLAVTDILVIVYVFLATLAPGLLILYLYKPEYIEKLESIKLVLFSFCLTSPVLLFNTLIVAMLSPKQLYSPPTLEEERKDYYLGQFIGGSAFTMFIFFVLLILAYYRNFSFKWFVGWILIIESPIFLLGAIISLKYFKKQDKSSAI